MGHGSVWMVHCQLWLWKLRATHNFAIIFLKNSTNRIHPHRSQYKKTSLLWRKSGFRYFWTTGSKHSNTSYIPPVDNHRTWWTTSTAASVIDIKPIRCWSILHQCPMSYLEILLWPFAAVYDGKFLFFLLGSAANAKSGLNWREFLSNSKTNYRNETRHNGYFVKSPNSSLTIWQKLHMTRIVHYYWFDFRSKATDDDATWAATYLFIW